MTDTNYEGVPYVETNSPVAQMDYFSFSSEETFTFPDGISQITFAVMNEGKKSKFQKITQRDLVMERSSGNARMKVDPSIERHALINESITGWNLKRGQGIDVPFNQRSRDDFMQLADPKVIEELEKAIRKANPWMLADMKSEDIQQEIDNLEEMKVIALEREAGELASSNK